MNAAILAAGEGSRLRTEGIHTAKPLIPVGGVPLIDRLIRLALASGADSLSVVINEGMTEVRRHCEELALPLPFHLLVRSTPSSMHSLFALEPFLRDAPFYCTTVDTVFLETEFARFLSFARRQHHADGVLGVTDFIDDEHPLCVDIDDRHRITHFSDTSAGYRWTTGGIYYFSPRIFELMPAAFDTGTLRLRNFLRLLLTKGYVLRAYPFSKVIDVDHAADIAVADQFIASSSTELTSG